MLFANTRRRFRTVLNASSVIVECDREQTQLDQFRYETRNVPALQLHCDRMQTALANKRSRAYDSVASIA